MKISLLCSDLSSNPLMRVYPIAKLLARHYDIEIVGPAYNGHIYEPYRDEFVYKSESFEEGWWDTGWRRRICSLHKAIVKPYHMIEGDVVYAFKPRMSSFVAGLLAKYVRKQPLLLDIDDWEAAEYLESSSKRRWKKLTELGDPQNFWYSKWLESCIECSDKMTVSSGFLQKRYGGVRVPHGADCDYFDPGKYDRDALREQWNVAKKTVVLFSGNAVPHKGIRELAEAIKLVGSRDLCLMIVGPLNGYLETIVRTSAGRVMYVPPQPHDLMPAFLALADLVVIPQMSTPYAAAQVPGKVFEAMAMGKPIIATAVSDLPEILKGCGWIVDSPEPQRLAEKIEYAVKHRDEAVAMGRKARERCLERYSWDAIELTLLGIFREYE